MRFKQFLRERVSSDGDFSVKVLSAKEAMDWMEKHAHNHLERMKAGHKIWRGTETPGVAAYKNTNDFTRRSANTYNLYTLWIDNHPAWKAFPQRSKSLVCTTSWDTATGYGVPHVIVPADKALVGICPESDMWESFEALAPEGKELKNFPSLESFVSICMYALRLMGYNETQVQLHWEKLEEALKQTQLDALKVSKDWKQGEPTEDELTFWLKEAGPTLYDVFEEVLDPRRNSFRSQKAGAFYTDKNQEVWVQGEVVLLNYNDIQRETNVDALRIKEFFGDNDINLEE